MPPYPYPRSISISPLCPQLLRPFSQPTPFFSPPITVQMRLCGLRETMRCHQTLRTSPLNCSIRTLWRDWVQVGQVPRTFLTTWTREEGGRVHAASRVRPQVWEVPLYPETCPAPSGQKSLESTRAEASRPCPLSLGSHWTC